MAKAKTPRWGWAPTGSGHVLKECLAMIGALEDAELFVSRAAAGVVRMYKQELKLPGAACILRDTPASAPRVGRLSDGVDHALVETLEALGAALARRKNELAAHG